MEKTNQKKGKIEVEELLKYPQLVERELEYWIKEKKVSFMERAIKANDMNTGFSGTVSLEPINWYCHSEDDDVMDMMYEEDEGLIGGFMEEIDFDDDDDSFAEAG